jgi:hypothetical protein
MSEKHRAANTVHKSSGRGENSISFNATRISHGFGQHFRIGDIIVAIDITVLFTTARWFTVEKP